MFCVPKFFIIPDNPSSAGAGSQERRHFDYFFILETAPWFLGGRIKLYKAGGCVCGCVKKSGSRSTEVVFSTSPLRGCRRHRGTHSGVWRLYVLQVTGQGVLRMLVFKVLLVGLGVWHLGLAHSACVDQGLGSSALLVVILLFFQLLRLLRRLLLRLNFLLSACHSPKTCVVKAAIDGSGSRFHSMAERTRERVELGTPHIAKVR